MLQPFYFVILFLPSFFITYRHDTSWPRKARHQWFCRCFDLFDHLQLIVCHLIVHFHPKKQIKSYRHILPICAFHLLIMVSSHWMMSHDHGCLYMIILFQTVIDTNICLTFIVYAKMIFGIISHLLPCQHLWIVLDLFQDTLQTFTIHRSIMIVRSQSSLFWHSQSFKVFFNSLFAIPLYVQSSASNIICIGCWRSDCNIMSTFCGRLLLIWILLVISSMEWFCK